MLKLRVEEISNYELRITIDSVGHSIEHLVAKQHESRAYQGIEIGP
jgi:hypothetical protein